MLKYSTTPKRDLLKTVIVTILVMAVCYLAYAIVPLGLQMKPRISNQAGLSKQELEDLLSKIAEQDFFYTTGETYRESFFQPWKRPAYDTRIVIARQEEGLKLVIRSTSPDGCMISTLRVHRANSDWDLSSIHAEMTLF
jgi:hypothetical protein